MTSITVGIEGPVLAGKSTLIREVMDRLNQRGVKCIGAPCFVEYAKSHSMTLPDVTPIDAAAQLAGVRFYLAIDKWRRPPTTQGVIFLDRTCWTLLAHTTTLAAMGIVDAVREVDMTVEQSGQMPEELVYLDVSHPQQIARAVARPGLPQLFLERMFNSEFRKFFAERRDQHRAHWVNADLPLDAVVASVELHILRRLEIDV